MDAGFDQQLSVGGVCGVGGGAVSRTQVWAEQRLKVSN